MSANSGRDSASSSASWASRGARAGIGIVTTGVAREMVNTDKARNRTSNGSTKGLSRTRMGRKSKTSLKSDRKQRHLMVKPYLK